MISGAPLGRFAVGQPGASPTPKLFNLAQMSTSTTGTDDVVLDAAVPSFLSFDDAGVRDGDTISYVIEDGLQQEAGRGVYSIYNPVGPTLTRDVLTSTNNNNRIALSGNAVVSAVPLAEDFDFLERIVGPRVVRPADAPSDGDFYGRVDGDWSPALALATGIILGTPRVPTPPLNNESRLIANTEWVLAEIAAFGEQMITVNSSMAITNAHAGRILYIDGLSSNITLTFDPIASIHPRFRVQLIRGDGSAFTVRVQSSAGNTIDNRSAAPLISQFDSAIIRVGGSTNFITESARYIPRILVYETNQPAWRPDENVPLGCLAIEATCVGGGGGGGGGVSGGGINYRGTGGGGGATTRRIISTASLTASVPITIGQGGGGGFTGNPGGGQTDGASGGTTSFGFYLTATGGFFGSAATGVATDGRPGGLAGGGDLNMLGGSSGVIAATVGPTPMNDVSMGGMAGGAFGVGGMANVGYPGQLYGGGTACNNHLPADHWGQPGAQGVCIISIPR